MSAPRRWIGLPVAAVVLVCGVVGVQLANGGGDYEPLRPADPCVERTVNPQATGIDGVTERLVLLGIDGAACRLHVSREALTLELAQTDEPTDAQIDALRAGLKSAVTRMKADGTLPRASQLVDESLESADLNELLKNVIRALPASVIDAAVKTDDVLIRAIDDLDLRAVLTNLDDQDALEQQVAKAVTSAVTASLEARIRGLV
ncbi:hypothetical protein ASE12_10430 [Aeromicrobium sp. Root236]|uniref:hypothetical protein n=1 Tax=Aeromicrobium sp. Root236 TaxID=1736498 RepID=UPI000701823A|nr:hypothetical protein [Aeromicrobium sp. Root236]KRC65144.1 hypothetical protein ASE12_10430 [Aeromicrobium sp. Root236]